MSLLMLDSGAFSVWNKGGSIDLDEYIGFCKSNPKCDYFVALDMIPGKPGVATRPDDVEEACTVSWRNYCRMIRELPIEKVIPVFHQGDSFDWLDRYLDIGAPYIGVSPANDRTTEQRVPWLKEVKNHLADSNGNLIVNTHGFAVTSFALMKFMDWHSVDSASWVRSAAYGAVYIPKSDKGKWLWDENPHRLAVSPKSPHKDKSLKHIGSIKGKFLDEVHRYLEEAGVPLGSYELIEVSAKYTVDRDKGELWYSREGDEIDKRVGFMPGSSTTNGNVVLRVTEEGIATTLHCRYLLNAYFLRKCNDHLGTVDHIYFAGANGCLRESVEYSLGRRLMSYYEIVKSSSASEAFNKHMEMKDGRHPSVS